MILGCDTSFLFALYGRNVHTARAIATVKSIHSPLTTTAFTECMSRRRCKSARARS